MGARAEGGWGGGGGQFSESTQTFGVIPKQRTESKIEIEKESEHERERKREDRGWEILLLLHHHSRA